MGCLKDVERQSLLEGLYAGDWDSSLWQLVPYVDGAQEEGV